MRDASRKTDRLLGHCTGGAIATITIGGQLGDRQRSGGKESGNGEAEASHLDGFCMYAKACWNM